MIKINVIILLYFCFSFMAVGQSLIKDKIAKITNRVNDYYNVSKTKNKDIGFSSGTFVIVDKDFKLYNELLKIVEELYGPEYCEKEELVANTEAYPRKSTHFNDYYLYKNLATKNILGNIKKTCEAFHFGIDIGEGKLKIPNKKHLLFGKIGNINGRDLIFIKPEEAGLKGFEAIKHGLDLIKSKVKQFIEKKFGKKFSRTAIDEISADTDEVNSGETQYRRERVPLDIISSFLEIINKDDKEAIKIAKAFGIHGILEVLAKAEYVNDAATKALINLIVNRYPEDYTMRFGNEIIIQ